MKKQEFGGNHRMVDVDVPVTIENVDTMLEFLEGEQEHPCHNSFLDFNEPQVMDNFTYRHSQHKEYGYAVNFSDDSN